jgi:hypothetical protein
MKRAEMARRGAEQLFQAENAVEVALCEVTALASTLGRMRLESNLSMVIGQDAMGALVETITMLSNARGAMVKAHGALDSVKTQIGCKTVASGNGDKGTGGGTTGTLPAAVLHVVSEEQSAA